MVNFVNPVTNMKSAGGGMKGAYKHTVLFEYIGRESTSPTADDGYVTFSVVIYNDDSTSFTRDTFFTYCVGKCLEAKGMLQTAEGIDGVLLFLQGTGGTLDSIRAYGASVTGATIEQVGMVNNGASEECYTITDYVEPNT